MNRHTLPILKCKFSNLSYCCCVIVNSPVVLQVKHEVQYRSFEVLDIYLSKTLPVAFWYALKASVASNSCVVPVSTMPAV